MVILLVVLGSYSINDFWWLFYWWFLVAILLMTFGGYSIDGSW
jgi:hypothetical protein